MDELSVGVETSRPGLYSAFRLSVETLNILLVDNRTKCSSYARYLKHAVCVFLRDGRWDDRALVLMT